MYYGKVKFFSNLKETLREGCEYRYPTQEERNKNKNLGDTPLDKNNHLMDCLRYIVQDLPYDFLDVKRVFHNNYLKFFDKLNTTNNKKGAEALSFNQLIDIINTEYKEEQNSSNSKNFFGGYSI
jgi:hypothetical protein